MEDQLVLAIYFINDQNICNFIYMRDILLLVLTVLSLLHPFRLAQMHQLTLLLSLMDIMAH